MTLSENCGLDLTVEDFKKYEWEPMLAEAERPTIRSFSTPLLRKARELKADGDEIGRRVFSFLGCIASMSIRDEESDEPFGQSGLVDNLTDADLNLIEFLAKSTKNQSMRARLADIIWVTRRNHQFAKIATESYLESFRNLQTPEAKAGDIRFLRRGLYLALLLGKKNEPYPTYIAFIQDHIKDRSEIETTSITLLLIKMLMEKREANVEECVKSASQISQRVESNGNLFLAQEYLGTIVSLHLANGNEEAAKKARIEKGECLLRDAEAAIAEPARGYLGGSRCLLLAVECLRQGGAPVERIKELHERALSWQGKARSEIGHDGHDFYIGDLVEDARSGVSGKELHDAVLTLAMRRPFTNRANLQERIAEQSEKFPLSFLFGATQMSHDGRFMDHKPGLLGTTEEHAEKAVEGEMFYQARTIDWQIGVRGYIVPCRDVIEHEHHPSKFDLSFLVENNPFVPPGHEDLYLRGIHAGFSGDMVLCAHLLVPQIEESIRHVLRQSGKITSKIDSRLLQEERLLGTLLTRPEVTEVFGEDCVFDLRGILCEKFGCDLRNRLAHGFLKTYDCFGMDVYMTWWMVIRLCAIPIYKGLIGGSSDVRVSDGQPAENDGGNPSPKF